jgi:hypothetical protein
MIRRRASIPGYNGCVMEEDFIEELSSELNLEDYAGIFQMMR